mmetsp:Transcript_23406/g.30454  ORF Transcript_23406/g.30454 Transcript_23406/m.30454 type:complete len:456 (-) Transcript_23406:726-2093(-)
MHSSGLRCSHNSELDTKIPRAKLPKRALPDCLRKKLKGVKVDDTNDDDSNNVYQAGSGVLAPVGSAPDGTFLKRGTGVPMSHRASALAQRRGDAANARATIFRAARVDGTIQRNDDRTSIRWSKANEKRKEEMKNVKMGRENNKSGSTSLPPINNRSGNQSSMNKSKNQSSKQQREQDQFQPIPIKRNNKADNKRRPTQSQHLDAFLQSGNTPRLLSEGEALLQSKKMSKPKYQVKFDLVNDALYIMNQVNQTYGKTMGTEDNPIYGAGDLGYLEQFFGPTISNKAAKAWLDEYLIDNDIVGKVSIEWSNDGNQQNQDNEGVSCKYNESQDKLNIIVNNSFPGISRAFGIQMFAHHEISTRGMRILNDIHQPWATDRRSHGLASQGSRETGATEEGLASIHSMIGCNDPNHRYLWNIAVLYYGKLCISTIHLTLSLFLKYEIGGIFFILFFCFFL